MTSAVRAATRWITPFVAAAAVVGLVVSAEPVQVVSAPAIRLVDESNPLAGRPFYVNPDSAAMRAAAGSDSPQLTAIANTPQAYWMDNRSTPSVDAAWIATAQASGATPILALYGIPHRDCGSYASGGFGSGDAYRGWIDGVAAAIGGGPAAIILEPDALAMADCLSGDQRQERFDLISYAVDRLAANPATAVYIDAGHSRWLSVEDMAARLNQVGIDRARGFSLNTANFFTTEESIGYGQAISGLTNGANFVIDTSRNGAGPTDEELYWCNPSGRALGSAPTTNTASPQVDAYLWVKRPGESDGSCRGYPSAGTFMNSYAIELASNAGW